MPLKSIGTDNVVEEEEVGFRLSHRVVNPTGVLLGRGSFAEVVEVEYNGKKYAAKNYRSKGDLKLSREIGIMSQIEHQHIVTFYGICKLAESEGTVIVMEKATNTLSAFLKDEAHIKIHVKVKILQDIVSGLQYLHNQTPAIIHRDLTVDNVLLTAEKNSKICDFGNARTVHSGDSAEPMTSNPGTIDYMAPEALDGGKYNEMVDVFAYGHLSIHVIIQRRPYPLLHHTYREAGQLIARSEVDRRQIYLKQMQAMLSSANLYNLHNLVTRCLKDVANERPSCKDIVFKFSDDIHVCEVESDIKIPHFEEWLPNTTVNATGVVLGKGAYGDVIEVIYKGKYFAAKKYRFMDSVNNSITSLCREHEILIQIRHPNIVKYYGFCRINDRSTVIVMERLEMDISHFLKEHHITLKKKTQILNDVANGLCHLHSQRPAIIHRDLTASNVLLNSSGTAKICDFTNSRIVDLLATPELLTSSPGTLDYMPPEAMEGGEYDDRVDVFSFGHLSIYVIIQHRPYPLRRPLYHGMGGKLIPRTELERRERYLHQMKLILDSQHNFPLYQLIIKCLNDDPYLRPSSAQILQFCCDNFMAIVC